MGAALTSGGSRIGFRVLGTLEASRDGQEISIAGSRQRALLTYLLLHANRVVPSERLIDELFGEEPPDNALNSVHAGISRLRRQLAAVGAADPIVTRAPGYMLELDPGQLDLHHFERLLEQGRRQLESGSAELAADTLRSALALWRGPPLADLTGYSFARSEATRLEELRLAAVADRIDADLALGRHAEVIGDLESLVARHRFQERLRGQLMLALYRAGRQADALQVYQDTRQVLVDELGLEPGKALQQLEQAILTQDPLLDAPQRSLILPPTASRSPRRLIIGLAVATAALAAVAVVALLRDGDSPPAAPVAIAANSVAVIDPSTNRLAAEIPVGESPKGIVAVPGSVWVVSSGDSTVSRIDSERRVVLRTIAVPGRPSDAAVDDAVWILHNRRGSNFDPFAGDASVSKIDPELLGVIDTFEVPAGFGNDYDDPIAVGGGAVWAGGQTGVTRIDPETGEVSHRISMPGVEDVALYKGELWVAQISGVLSRVDRATGLLTQAITLGSASLPVAIAVGGQAVWVTSRPGSSCCPIDEDGTGTVFRVDPATNEVVSRIRIGGRPRGIAVSEDAVWVTDAKANAVVRIDPATNNVVARIPIGGEPVSVAVADGAVWVTVT